MPYARQDPRARLGQRVWIVVVRIRERRPEAEQRRWARTFKLKVVTRDSTFCPTVNYCDLEARINHAPTITIGRWERALAAVMG
jgi:hypothetical protein